MGNSCCAIWHDSAQQAGPDELRAMQENQAPSSTDVTQLFVSWRNGDAQAFDALFAALYSDLRMLAHRQASQERESGSLRTTALVHEAYLRLVQSERIGINDRSHFFALAARIMRNVLVDKSRERGRHKRGGDMHRVELDEHFADGAAGAPDVLAVDSALSRLAQLDARQAEVAHLRVFGGLSVEEMADVLEISAATVKRDWRKARLFLMRELHLDSAP